MKLRNFSLIILCCTSVGIPTVAAEPTRCRVETDHAGARVTGTNGHYMTQADRGAGVPLLARSVMKVLSADGKSELYYQLPVGFRTGWLNPHESHSFREGALVPGNSFTFWMPELRHPERPSGISLTTTANRCEHGRPIPPDDHFLVTVEVRPHYWGEDIVRKHRRSGTPEERWQKMFRKPGMDIEVVMASGMLTVNRSREAFREPKSLGEIRPELFPIGDGDVFYRHPEGYPYQFFLHCAGIGKPGRCIDNQFFFPELNLNLEIRFTRDHLDKWQEIGEATLKLLDHWQIEAPTKGN